VCAQLFGGLQRGRRAGSNDTEWGGIGGVFVQGGLSKVVV